MYGQRTGRPLKSAIGSTCSPNCAFSSLTFWCGTRRNSSSTPSSCISSSVDGCTVSPRKSRRKSRCFSSTVTLRPARASSRPSIMPAGPPPAMQHCVVSMRPSLPPAEVLPGWIAARDARAVGGLEAGHALAGNVHPERRVLLMALLLRTPGEAEAVHQVQRVERRSHLHVVVEVHVDVLAGAFPGADAPRPAVE